MVLYRETKSLMSNCLPVFDIKLVQGVFELLFQAYLSNDPASFEGPDFLLEDGVQEVDRDVSCALRFRGLGLLPHRQLDACIFILLGRYSTKFIPYMEEGMVN